MGSELASEPTPARLGPVTSLSDHVSAGDHIGPIRDDLRRTLLWSTWRENAHHYALFGALGTALLVTYLSDRLTRSDSLRIEPYYAAAVTLYYLISTLRQVLALRQDFAAGEVRQADGVVTLNRGRLQVTYPGQAPLSFQHVGVPPGRYRFYFLPRSGYYLAYQPILPASAPTPADPLPSGADARLERLFHFTAADLSENRVGRRSQAQIMRARWRLLGSVAVVLALAGLGAWYVIARDLPELFWCLLFFTPFLIFLDGRRLLHNLRRAEVLRLEGVAVALTVKRGLYSHDVLLISGKSLPIPLAALHEIQAGAVYRVHVTPRSSEILSLERLEATQRTV